MTEHAETTTRNPLDSLSAQRMEELAFRYADGKNALSAERALAHCSDDYVFIVATEPAARFEGRSAVATHLKRLWAAFPDLYSHVDSHVVGPTGLVALGTLSGTMRGAYFGAPATGCAFKVPLVSAFEYANDRICQETNYIDGVALLSQIELPAEAMAAISTASR